MVKIVKLEPDESVVKQIVCKKCGATLEYVPMDIKKLKGRDYDGGACGSEYIECPNCHNHVVIRTW